MEDDNFHKLRVKLMDKFLVQPTLRTPHEKSTVDWHCLLPECKKNFRVFKRRDGWIAHHAAQHSALRNEEPYPNECEAKQFVREHARRRRLHREAARGLDQATMPLPLALSTLVAPTPLNTAPPPPAPAATTPLDTALPPAPAAAPIPLDSAPCLAPAAPTPLDTAPPPAPAAPTPLDTAPPLALDAPTPLGMAPPPPAPAADRRCLLPKAFRGAESKVSEDWHCIQQLIKTHRKNCRAIQRRMRRNEQVVEELGNHLHLALKRKRNTVDEPELSVDSPIERGEDLPAERAEDPPADQAESAPAELAERAEDAPAFVAIA